jgi:hypothetical protein
MEKPLKYDQVERDPTKQDLLVSGQNIKTINGESILGTDNLVISGGSSQNLQSVLDNGGVAFLTSPNNEYSSIVQVRAEDTLSYTSIATTYANYSGGVFSLNGKVYFSQQFDSFSSRLTFADPIAVGGDLGGGANFIIPAKQIGTYTLATTDDIKLKEYTVATLPTGTKGDVAFVNNALTPTFLAPVVGGGSIVVRVFHNGTTWVVQ